MKETQDEIYYKRIAEAIRFIRDNRKEQPRLEAMAAAVNMSPFHFQRIFKQWAGITPKHFLQYLDIEYAKRILKKTHASLFDTAVKVGLSGTSRLHDMFIKIEGMTPGEYKNGGENLLINYSFSVTPFGDILIASTPRGICSMEFADDHQQAFTSLRKKFPRASFRQMSDNLQQNALSIFTLDWKDLKQIKLHLKGTAFQIKVWETLLKIPMGGMTSYKDIAANINHPHACQAVGSAVSKNPVAFLIPCHRVIRATGEIGNYHWGDSRKMAILGWEAAKTTQKTHNS
ncbi:MAG: methylated-DNA--[protein]-cysteine S-methyltransferase [Prevotella sp.]|jgi:AraC family transcriptional regulator of adaptative response/methylated-DNA-[protein]-cysteine methyltransferase